MLENFYLIAKIISISCFISVAIILLVLACKAKSIKQELEKAEMQIKTQITSAYNIGVAAVNLILGLLIAKSSSAPPFWLKFLKLTSLAKFDIFYSPIKAIIEAFLEIKEKLSKKTSNENSSIH